MAAMGSDAWLCAENYEVGDEFHTRAIQLFASLNWDNLAARASKLRDGIGCIFSEKYSIGNFNLVRRIIFADQVSWIARVRLPQLASDTGGREALDVPNAMRLEIGAANYIRANTTIPVPEVYGQDLDPSNDVGAPFTFMEYIHGTLASELWQNVGVFGSPAQNEHFWEQMASIHVKLASLQFNRIGGIYQEGESFTIGPELETGLGPFDTSEQYFTALAEHVLEVAKKAAPTEFRESEAFELPSKFMKLIQLYGVGNQQGPFGIVNRDLGTHNVLVDNNLNIVGLIDLDGVLSAPTECIAQFPDGLGIERPIPGNDDTNPISVGISKSTAHFFEKYIALMRAAITKEAAPRDVSKVADLMMSEASSVVEGLKSYSIHDEELTEDWMAAYKRLLSGKSCASSKVAEGSSVV